jgi:hypothetical protein
MEDKEFENEQEKKSDENLNQKSDEIANAMSDSTVMKGQANEVFNKMKTVFSGLDGNIESMERG